MGGRCREAQFREMHGDNNIIPSVETGTPRYVMTSSVRNRLSKAATMTCCGGHIVRATRQTEHARWAAYGHLKFGMSVAQHEQGASMACNDDS